MREKDVAMLKCSKNVTRTTKYISYVAVYLNSYLHMKTPALAS